MIINIIMNLLVMIFLFSIPFGWIYKFRQSKKSKVDVESDDVYMELENIIKELKAESKNQSKK